MSYSNFKYGFYLFFKNKKLFLTLFFSILGTVLAGTLLMTPEYQSSAKLLLQRETEIERAVTRQSSINPDYNWLETEMEILKSRPISRRVIDDLKLVSFYFPDADSGGSELLSDKTREIFYESLSLETIKSNEPNVKNNVLKISYQMKDPLLCQKVISQLINGYLTYRVELFNETETYKFFNEQLEIAEKKLDELEESESDYRLKTAIVSPEQSKILLQKLADYEKKLTEARTQRIGKEAKIKVVRQKIKEEVNEALPPEFTENFARSEYLANLMTDRSSLEIEKASLLHRFTPKYEEIKRIDEKIRATSEQIGHEIQQIISQEETAVEVLKTEEQVLEESIQDIRLRLNNLLSKQSRISNLQRKIDNNREIYSMLLKQREEARIGLAKLQRGVAIKIIDPPERAFEPVKPNRRLFAVAGLLLALFVAVMTIIIKENIFVKISTAQDVENELKLPVFASVHHFSDLKE